MIQADKDFMKDWCGYVSRDARMLSDVIGADPAGLVYVENVAYQFAQMALFNLSKVCLDDKAVNQLVYHAALGLMKGAADGLAMIDAGEMHINNERKN